VYGRQRMRIRRLEPERNQDNNDRERTADLAEQVCPTLASLLRLNLFAYRDLQSWLNHPFETPPFIPGPQQLSLPLPGFGQEGAQTCKQTST